VVQLRVLTPFVVSHVDAPAPNAVQLPLTWQAPNWKTPTGPAGEARVLVTYA
jgi:hypothetical protein